MSHGRHADPLQLINTEHRDELLAAAQALGGHPDATSARAERVDPTGIDLVVETPRGPVTARVDFAAPVRDYPDGLRAAFVELTTRARATLT